MESEAPKWGLENDAKMAKLVVTSYLGFGFVSLSGLKYLKII